MSSRQRQRIRHPARHPPEADQSVSWHVYRARRPALVSTAGAGQARIADVSVTYIVNGTYICECRAGGGGAMAQDAGVSRWTEADLPDLSGRTAVVTGANAGLGLQIAKVLAGH